MKLHLYLTRLTTVVAIMAMILMTNPLIFAEETGNKETSQLTEVLKKDQPRDFECGQPFVDPRDGQSYNTVQIGSQCWMAENLNYGVRINAGTDMLDNGIVEKYCYDDDPNNCDLYGGIYQWDEIMNHTILEGYRGICPEGWHVPSDADWCTLEQAVDPTINCTAIFWRGTDGGTKLKSGGSSGFEGLLAGHIFMTSSSQLGDFGYFWTSSEYNEWWSVFRALGHTEARVRRHQFPKSYGYSVRCLKGEGTINQPPSAPSNPTPDNGAENQSVGVELMWECTDPEGDPIHYDVYIGTTSNPPLAASGITGITYSPGPLQHLTTYFWKIVATDNQGNSTEGPVWSFTTMPQSGFFTCGQVFTDTRDGNQYNTVKIGEQCWMAQNLRIGEQINANVQMTDNGIIEKYCYDNDPANCNTFGGLYQWNEMMQYSTQQGIQGICPAGWRLPTDNEWKELEGYADSQYPIGDPIWDGFSWRGSDVGGNLKQVGTSNWNSPNAGATNSTGFTALPGGYSAGDSFLSKGQMGWHWTSTQHSSSNALLRVMHASLSTVMRNDYTKIMGASVRCIRGNFVPNEPPSTPANPSPANGATGQSLQPTLSWVSTDPDGDPVTFDVYFGTVENPPLVAEDIDQNSFSPGTLEYKTTYYWKIVAHDDQGNSATGPVWSFTTTPLYFTVTFNVQNEAGVPLENAVITLDGVTNAPGNYVFNQVEEGTYSYIVALENHLTAAGNVTVVDENVDVVVTMYGFVVVDDLPFTEDFSSGTLPQDWLNIKLAGDYEWEFAQSPFPHAFIHNINRPVVNARLITPKIDASETGQLILGINQRFMTQPAGGVASIVVSEEGLNWETIAQYTASIGSGDDFEYIEFNLDQYAGKKIFVGLEADFPDTDAAYEALWEVESLTVFEPGYSVTFEVMDINNNSINNATITLDELTNAAGDYLFEDVLAGTYRYIVRAEGYMPVYDFVTLTDQSITETVTMKELLVINEFPYVQDFEENVLPEGWNNIILGDPDGYWRFEQGWTQIQSGWGDRTHALLVSPAFDCSNMDAVAVGLNHYYMDIYGVGFAEIVGSTDGENWNTIVKFQDETVGSFSFPYFEYYATEWAAGQEQVFIGLLYDDLASTEFWWIIDAFTFFEPMPHAVSVENLMGNKYVNEGESFTFDFEISNMGANDDTYDLEVLNADWNYVMSQETIFIEAGQKETVSVTVTVPFDVEMGEMNELLLQATSQGDNSVSATDMFITVAVSTIKAYYHENFDLAVTPSLPGGWSKIQQSSVTSSRVQTTSQSGIAPVSPPNQAELYTGNDLDPNLVLISPKIDESVDLKDFRVLFKLRTSSDVVLKLGTMNSPTGQFTELDTMSTANHFTWEYRMYAFNNYQGSDRYIAFKLDPSQTNRGAYLDDITIEIIPPPILKVTPTSHDFGEYWVEYPSEVPLVMDLRNVGHDIVFVNSISLDNNDDFFFQDHAGVPAQLHWNQFIPVDVYFKATSEGPKTANLIIEFNDGAPKTKIIPLEGVGIPRPQGSTCDDPIALQLPVIDYEGSTIEHGNDFGINWVNPGTNYLGGYDMVFSFTIDEESYLNGSIEGPYYGPGLQIVAACPHPVNRPIVLAWAQGMYGGSFEDVIIPAGDYLAIVGSRAASSSWPYYTEFVLNLEAVPTPNLYDVTFNLLEDSPEQAPVEGADIYITGFQTDLVLKTNIQGQANLSLYEGDYGVYIYKKDFHTHQFVLEVASDTTLNIPMNDMIWTPHSLNVETAGLYPGQAHFTWMPKPLGEPWTQGFEGDYPPNGWDTIVTNNGQVEDPIVDWKFTWQKYGTVYFMDATAHPKEGNYHAFVHWSSFPQDEWLISHEFEAPAGDLEFWYFGRNGAPYSDYFVKVSTDGGDTWFTAWNASTLPPGRNDYDYPVYVDLQPWAGQNIRVAWNAYGPDYGLYGAWIIDKISVGDMRINPEDLLYVSKIDKPSAVNHTGTIPSTRDDVVVPRVTWEDMGYRSPETRVNKGFSIYLDDLQTPVAQGIKDPEFMFIGLAAGNYLAGVQAVYSTGQSEIVTIPFNNPVSGVEYNVDFSVQDESGVPVNDATIEVLYAGQLLHTLTTLNGAASVQLFSGDYDFVVAKENFKTYYGEFSVTNAAVNVSVLLEEGYQTTFLVKNTEDQPIQGATVFVDGSTITTAFDGSAFIELTPGEYPFSVTHPEYDAVLSFISVNAVQTVHVVMNNLTCEAPENLNAQLWNNDVILQWEAPEPGLEGKWAHWDGPHANNSIGSGGPMDLDIAQRFNTFDVRPYDGDFLTRIMFVPHEVFCTYSVRVWLGGNANGPGTLVVDQVVLNPVIGEWNEVFLHTPVFIDDSQELWFGVRINTTTGYPAGRDIGPAIDGKGNMVRLPGNNWQTLLQVNPNLDYNWSVRAFMEEPDGRTVELLPALEDGKGDDFTGALNTTDNDFDLTLSEPRILLGYNVYRNDEMINTQIITDPGYIDQNTPSGLLNYNVTALWSNSCESEFSNTAAINKMTQQFSFNEGWNSMSAYIVPATPDVEDLFEPVVNNLAFMMNLTAFYWPQQGINMIGDFDNNSGYAMKFNAGVDFVLNGNEMAQSVLTLPEGWNYLPVLSECEVNTASLLGINADDVAIIQELIGTKVYWPAMGIYTLDQLLPGKAYKIKTLSELSLTFPECDQKGSLQVYEQINSIPTVWGEMLMTPQSQPVVFKQEAMAQFADGDMIGAFGVDGVLYGYMQVTGKGQNHAITLFGDASYGASKDGFSEGERISYRLYRASTGEEFDLRVEYDHTMNATGNFHPGSFAAVIKTSLDVTGMGEISSAVFSMYPNPASEVVYFSYDGAADESVTVLIYDAKGQAVTNERFTQNLQLNTASLDAGVYFVKISTQSHTEVRKLIIK
jgi:uncharacterized protein (TIGR02145 family)